MLSAAEVQIEGTEGPRNEALRPGRSQSMIRSKRRRLEAARLALASRQRRFRSAAARIDSAREDAHRGQPRPTSRRRVGDRSARGLDLDLAVAPRSQPGTSAGSSSRAAASRPPKPRPRPRDGRPFARRPFPVLRAETARASNRRTNARRKPGRSDGARERVSRLRRVAPRIQEDVAKRVSHLLRRRQHARGNDRHGRSAPLRDSIHRSREARADRHHAAPEGVAVLRLSRLSGHDSPGASSARAETPARAAGGEGPLDLTHDRPGAKRRGDRTGGEASRAPATILKAFRATCGNPARAPLGFARRFFRRPPHRRGSVKAREN